MTVCAISAVKCLAGSICSSSRMKSQLMLLFDFMLAVVMITPLVTGIRNFSLPELSTADYAEFGYSQELYNEALAEQTSRNIEEILMEQIASAGINCSNITAEVNISEDGSISITKVTVTSEEFESAAGIIYCTLGRETEVAEGVDE